MVLINIFIICIFIIAFILTQNYDKKFIKNLYKKEHPLIILYPLCSYIFNRKKIFHMISRNSKLKQKLRQIYREKKWEDAYKEFICKKLSITILIFVIFNMLSITVSFSENKSELLQKNIYIRRPEFGDGSQNVDLNIMFQNEKEVYKEKVTLEINEQRPDLETEKKIIEESKKYIEKNFLGENTSLDNINQSVVLVDSIPGTGITVEWVLDTEGIIDRKGNVHNEDISGDGMLISIKAIFQYYEKEIEYIIHLNVVPKVLSYKEMVLKNIVEKILKEEKNSLNKKVIKLPDKVGETKVYYGLDSKTKGVNIFVFGMFMSIALFILWNRKLDDELKKRKNQMMIDYPEIINKFTLLIGAGMNIKNAWGKIVSEYKENVNIGRKNKRYAYEEMVFTWNELINGRSEEEAYDEFGRRTNLLLYMKFSSMLSQNIKKGSKGLAKLFEYEAYEAFEERKEIAKKLGEEAGTKLLGPMIIMLLIVFMIIIIPAFLSF